MKITRATSETAVFVLQLDALRRLHSDISTILPKVEVAAACSDRLQRKFQSFEEFERFANPERASIEELLLTARDERHENRLSLTLNTERRRNWRVWIDADESVAMQLNDVCINLVDASRPWYSWIARLDWYTLVFGGWLLAQVGGLILVAIKHADEPLRFTMGDTTVGLFSRSIGSGVAIGLVPILVGIAANVVRDRIFPAGVFALGDGAARHSRNEVTRTVLVAAFAVSVVASIVVSWFI